MMRVITLLIALISCAVSLKVNVPASRVSSHHFSSVDDAVVVESKPSTRILAKWFPFGGLKAPKALDGELAADVGFDPIGKYTCTICYYVTYSFCDALKTIDGQASPRVRRPCTG